MTKKTETVPPQWAAPATRRMNEIGCIQDGLKQVLDVKSRGAVGHYFTGRRQLDADKAAALATRLNLDLSAMMKGEYLLICDRKIEHATEQTPPPTYTRESLRDIPNKALLESIRRALDELSRRL